MTNAMNAQSENAPAAPERTPLERRLEGLDGNHAASPQLGFMLAGAQWRDSWLQGFRSLYLVMEVILLGLAGGLLVSVLNLDVARAWVPTVLLVVDGGVGLVLLSRGRRQAVGLGDDVRFWHREIIRAERELPPDRRIFTRFKLLQRSRHHLDTPELTDVALSEVGLNESAIDRVVEPFSSSATRRLIENRVPMLIAVLWFAWVIAGLVVLYLKATQIIP
jgi:hypothetical protein